MEILVQMGSLLMAILILFGASAFLLRLLPQRFKISKSVTRALLGIMIFPFQRLWALFVLFQNRELDFTQGHVVIHDAPVTPLQFLAVVEGLILNRQIPDARITRVLRWHGGFLSPRRTYLRIRQNNCIALIGAVPLGTALLASWRTGEIPSPALTLLGDMPGVAGLTEQLIRRPTLYRTDALFAFQGLVRDAVLEAVEQLTHQPAIRNGYAGAAVPILRDFYLR